MTKRSVVLVVLIAAGALRAIAACTNLREATPDDDAGTTPGDTTGEEDSDPGADGASKKPDAAKPGTDAGAAPDGQAPAGKRTVVVLASGFTQPVSIAVAGDLLFFTLEFDQTATVRKVLKDGGGSDVVSPYDAASGENPLGNDIAVAGTDVVWANGTAGAGGVYAIPVAGGPIRKVEFPLDTPYHATAFGGQVYWVDEAFNPDVYAIYRAPLAGGAPSTVATYQVRVGGIAVDATGIYWSQGGPLANGKNGVRKNGLTAAPDASADLSVGDDNGDVGGIAIDGTYVYWADMEAGRVLRVAKTGGTTTVLADSLASPMNVAVDGAYVYYTEHGLGSAKDGRVSRVAIAAGGTPEVLAKGQDHPLGIALDATYVYWTNYGGGEVLRVEREPH